MCGRYTNTLGPEQLGKSFGVDIPISEGTRRYNIAPTENVLAIVRGEQEPHARLLRWGLIPTWSTDTKTAHKMINARVETVATSPAYRSLIDRSVRRALALADGYYEWQKPEQPKAPRQPFHFQVDHGAPFAFAALWTPAKIDGQWIHSMSILTRDSSSNRTVAAIHDRMPVILADRETQDAWLDPTMRPAELLDLCQPISEQRTTVTAANPEVNKAGTEGPHLLRASV